MKKCLYVILFIGSMFLVNTTEVQASSGFLRKNSIKSCNGVMYGQHSGDNHWHMASYDGERYHAVGDPFYYDPCPNNNSSNNNVTPDTSSSNNTSDNSTSNSNANTNSSNNNTTSTPPVVEEPKAPVESNNNNNVVSGSSNNTAGNNTISPSKEEPVKKEEGKDTAEKEEDKPKSSDNTLKKLIIDGKELDIEDNIEYTTKKEKLDIKVTPNDKNATYTVKGNTKLIIGENEIVIEVVAEDKSTKEYVINATRERVLSSNTDITISINEMEITIYDNKGSTTVSPDVTKVSVEYKLADEKSKVEISELGELEFGDNLLTIKVIAEDGTIENYEVTIHKNTQTEETIGIVLSFGIIGGMGYGIYYAIKKVKDFFKNKFKK